MAFVSEINLSKNTKGRYTFAVPGCTQPQYCKSSHRKQQVFLTNRVAEILLTTDVSQQKHVSGILNPPIRDCK